MRPCHRLAISLIAVLCGPVPGYTPGARAGFIHTQPPDCLSLPELASFQNLPPLASGADSPCAAAAAPCQAMAERTPDPVPEPRVDRRPAGVPVAFLPPASGPGAGPPPGATTRGGVAMDGPPPTAGLPSPPSPPADELVGGLALKEISFRPPPFPSRLFRPPRRGAAQP